MFMNNDLLKQHFINHYNLNQHIGTVMELNTNVGKETFKSGLVIHKQSVNRGKINSFYRN